MGIFAFESRCSLLFIYSSDFFNFGKKSISVPILGETGNGGFIQMRSYPDHRQAIKAKPG